MPTTINNQIKFNTYKANNPMGNHVSQVTYLSDGKALMVESTDYNGTQFVNDFLSGQLVSASGELLTSQQALITINADQSSYQYNPSVATLSNGDVVVVWQRLPSLSSPFSYTYAQLLDNEANKIGNEFIIFAEGVGGLPSPNVKALKGGGFVVVCNTTAGVKAILFDNSAAVKKSAWPIDSNGDCNVIALENNTFVINWPTQSYDTAQQQIIYTLYGQLYNAEGLAINSTFVMDSYSCSNCNGYAPLSGQALNNGNFVVAWGGPSTQQKLKVFDESGNALTSSFDVGSYTNAPTAIVSLSEGLFIPLTGDRADDLYITPLSGQLYNGTSNPLDERFIVDFSLPSLPAATATGTRLANGNFMVVWQYTNTYGQIFYGGNTLTATNLEQAFNHTASTINFDDIKVFSLGNKITVKVALPSPDMGTLEPIYELNSPYNDNSLHGAFSAFNTSTGIWTASGLINSVNNILKEAQFIPAQTYPSSNFNISIQIEDILHAPIIGNIQIIKSAEPSTTASDTDGITTQATTALDMTSTAEPTTVASTSALGTSTGFNPTTNMGTSMSATATSLSSSTSNTVSTTSSLTSSSVTSTSTGTITTASSTLMSTTEQTTSSISAATSSSQGDSASSTTTEDNPLVSSAVRPTSYVGQFFSRTSALASSLSMPISGDATQATNNPLSTYSAQLPDFASSLVLYKVLGQMGSNAIQSVKKLWQSDQTQDNVDPTALKNAEAQLIRIEQTAQHYYRGNEHYASDHFRWQIEHLRDDFNQVKTATELAVWLADFEDAEKVLVAQQSRGHFFKDFSVTLTSLEASEDRWAHLRSNRTTLKSSQANLIDDNHLTAPRMLR